MARKDPQKLETLRRKMTERIINNAENEQKRRRLEGLAFRVDMERKRARSPLQATIRISELMCHSLADLHRSMVTPLVDDKPQKNSVATVIEFASPGTETEETEQ